MAPSSSVDEAPMWQKIVGISLALASGCLIGSSVVFTKKGLMMSRSIEPGRQHAYLKNYMWWIGMILTALGEVANFGAYAFAPAILVTPLGAISVVISAVLSSFFLKERLNFSGKVGCALCIIGATIIVLHAPASSSTQTINEFISYILAPSFLVYTIVLASILLFLIFYLKPRYGQRSPLIYISISSIIGAYLVLSASGFGAALVYSVRNWNTDNQFKQWAIYPVFAFIVVTVILQIHFLNLGLAYFSASVVTPIYYVFFTTATLVTSAVLFRGFPVDSAAQGLSIVMGFMVIVGGVALLFEYSMQLLAAAAAANASAATAVASSVSSIHNNNIAGGAAGAADKNSGTAGPTGRMSRSGSVTSSLAPVGLRRSSATAVGGGMVQLPERRFAGGCGDAACSIGCESAAGPYNGVLGTGSVSSFGGEDGGRFARLMASRIGTSSTAAVPPSSLHPSQADNGSFYIVDVNDIADTEAAEPSSLPHQAIPDAQAIDAASFATVPGLPIFAAAAVLGPTGTGAGSFADFERARSISHSMSECGRGCRQAMITAYQLHTQAVAMLHQASAVAAGSAHATRGAGTYQVMEEDQASASSSSVSTSSTANNGRRKSLDVPGERRMPGTLGIGSPILALMRSVSGGAHLRGSRNPYIVSQQIKREEPPRKMSAPCLHGSIMGSVHRDGLSPASLPTPTPQGRVSIKTRRPSQQSASAAAALPPVPSSSLALEDTSFSSSASYTTGIEYPTLPLPPQRATLLHSASASSSSGTLIVEEGFLVAVTQSSESR